MSLSNAVSHVAVPPESDLYSVSLRSDEGAQRWAAIDYEVQTKGILIDPDDLNRR